jgi:murein DD-endopeptidase MepM/ murein hydrolase activator NlpD
MHKGMTAMELSPSKLALAALLPLLAGCATESPRTVFDWGVNDRQPIRQAARHDARTYAYRDASVPVPTPRPDGPAYRAPSRASYTSAPLAAPSRAVAKPAPSYDSDAAIAFAWPVRGTVISDFGANDTGGRNDGINIATAKDAPIRASASGTVTYAGNELKDYGNLVLIKHADGYVTAYAHADRLLVSRGDTVSAGQVIGYAGETGNVSSPQLHFEIRRDTRPVNPRPLLVARNS